MRVQQPALSLDGYTNAHVCHLRATSVHLSVTVQGTAVGAITTLALQPYVEYVAMQLQVMYVFALGYSRILK